MANATTNPNNDVYFQFYADGLYNATVIASKTPAFLSKPRLVGVGQSARNTVVFQNITTPLIDNGQTAQDIEPNSGIPMHAVAQSQFNVAIAPLPGIILDEDTPNITATWFPNVTEALVPVFWVIQEAGIGDADANQFKNDFYGAMWLSNVIQIGGYVLFGLLVLTSLAMVFYGTHQHRHHRRRHHEKQPLLTDGMTGVGIGAPDPGAPKIEAAKVSETSSEYGEEEGSGSGYGAIDLSYQNGPANQDANSSSSSSSAS